MEQIIDLLIAKGSVALVNLLGIAALFLLTAGVNFLRSKTKLAAVQWLLVEFEETARPHIKHFFEEESKAVLKAAEDGKIDDEEKKRLLKEIGARAREEYLCLYGEIIGKLEKVMPNVSDFLDKKFSELYEELKARFQS